MAHALPAPRAQLEGRGYTCETQLATAGAYQLTLSSTVAALAVELHSSYLGHPDARCALACHLRLRPGATPELTDRRHDARELPVVYARRRCLLDHLHELRDLLADSAGQPVQVDVDDAALELVDRG